MLKRNALALELQVYKGCLLNIQCYNNIILVPGLKQVSTGEFVKVRERSYVYIPD